MTAREIVPCTRSQGVCVCVCECGPEGTIQTIRVVVSQQQKACDSVIIIAVADAAVATANVLA